MVKSHRPDHLFYAANRNDGLIKALAHYHKEKRAVRWILSVLGFESPAFASSIFMRYPQLLVDYKAGTASRARLADKVEFFDRMGLGPSEIVENCDMLWVEDNELLDHYYLLSTLGVPHEMIRAPTLTHVIRNRDLLKVRAAGCRRLKCSTSAAF